MTALEKTGRRTGGFTIVEVLMVVAIMTLLFGLVIVATSTVRKNAAISSTKALISRLRNAIADYHQSTGHYPPDGFDSDVRTKEGTHIFGSAALYDALTHEITIQEKISGQVRPRTAGPFMEFRDSEITPDDENFPGAREILDGFGVELHYDNTEDGHFDPDKQIEVAHLIPPDDHPPDPRISDDTDVVPRPGIQSNGAYDLWSHGSAKAHKDPKTSPKSTIGSWNVGSDKKRAVEEDER